MDKSFFDLIYSAPGHFNELIKIELCHALSEAARWGKVKPEQVLVLSGPIEKIDGKEFVDVYADLARFKFAPCDTHARSKRFGSVSAHIILGLRCYLDENVSPTVSRIQVSEGVYENLLVKKDYFEFKKTHVAFLRGQGNHGLGFKIFDKQRVYGNGLLKHPSVLLKKKGNRSKASMASTALSFICSDMDTASAFLYRTCLADLFSAEDVFSQFDDKFYPLVKVAYSERILTTVDFYNLLIKCQVYPDLCLVLKAISSHAFKEMSFNKESLDDVIENFARLLAWDDHRLSVRFEQYDSVLEKVSNLLCYVPTEVVECLMDKNSVFFAAAATYCVTYMPHFHFSLKAKELALLIERTDNIFKLKQRGHTPVLPMNMTFQQDIHATPPLKKFRKDNGEANNNKFNGIENPDSKNMFNGIENPDSVETLVDRALGFK